MPGWLESFLEVHTPLLLVVLLRLAIGAELAYQGYDKINEGYIGQSDALVEGLDHKLAAKLKSWIGYEASVYETGPDGERTLRTVTMLSWYRGFLDRGVLPNVKVFAALVCVAELALGILLILGLLTRIATVLGGILLLNYLFATWHMYFPYQMFNILFLVCLLVLGLVQAGRCLGLDQFLHEKYPEIPLF